MAFVVLIQQPVGKISGKRHRILPLTDEDEEVCQFATAKEAKAAAKGHHWEHVWAWFVIELADGAVVESP